MKALPQGTLTLLFTDIEGSTRLSVTLGEEYADLLEEHRRLLRAAVAGRGGLEVDTQGDAFFFVFNGAREAVRAAVEAQRALAPLGDRLRVRMGVHTGEPQLTAAGYYVGLDLSLTARICAAAHGGQIIVSPTTRELVGGETALVDLGEHVLKDIAAPVRLFQVLEQGLPDQFPPPRARPPGNLSQAEVEIYGRAQEIADVQNLLRDQATLVTLTGPGGVGKTTTAIAAASGLRDVFRDGIYFVSFAAAKTILDVLAQILEVEERADEDLLERLVDRLTDRAILLVFDDFDSLVESAADVGELLDRCPGLKILTTSRERLHLRAEREYRLAPLAEDDAVTLFSVRAAFAGGIDDMAGQTDVVHAICRRLDGLPLAVELAAAHARALPLQTILERLEQRLRFLRGGARDLPARQQTLTATIEWSYDLLAAEERTALRALSVFAGGIPLAGAESVVGEGALELLISLRDKSLLARSGRVGAAPRFSMLDTIRDYALDRLAMQGEEAAARARHARFFLELVEQLQRELSGARQADALRTLGEEHENIRAALAWCDEAADRERLVAFCAGLWRYWLVRGHLTEARAWLARALEPPGEPRPALANALFGACAVNAAAGEFELARRYGAERVEVTRALGDDGETASALAALANVNVHLGERDTAAQLYEEAAAAARAAAARPVLAAIVNNLGYLELLRDDPQSAATSCSEAAALFDELGRPLEAAGARLNIASARLALEQHADAAAELATALDEYTALESEEGISYCLDASAALALAEGETVDAVELAAAAASARGRKGVTAEPLEQRRHDETVAAARSELEETAFAAAWDRGGSVPLTQAVEAAAALLVRREAGTTSDH